VVLLQLLGGMSRTITLALDAAAVRLALSWRQVMLVKDVVYPFRTAQLHAGAAGLAAAVAAEIRGIPVHTHDPDEHLDDLRCGLFTLAADRSPDARPSKLQLALAPAAPPSSIADSDDPWVWVGWRYPYPRKVGSQLPGQPRKRITSDVFLGRTHQTAPSGLHLGHAVERVP
jgi:hypothetical protein